MRTALAAYCSILSLTPLAILAEVKVVVRPDGSQHMYNVGRARQTPAPAASRDTAGDLDLDSLVGRYARQARLEKDLVNAVVQVESSFDPTAVSRRGAMGLMQLMPETARSLGVSDPFDPAQNLEAGTRYLRRMLDVFDGNLELALAAYNAGPEAVRRFGGIPPYRETIDYVEKVVRRYRGDSSYVVRASRQVGRGRRTYLTRDSNGGFVLTTTPPRGG